MNYPCPKTPRLEPALLRWLAPNPPLAGKYTRLFTNRREELKRTSLGDNVHLDHCGESPRPCTRDRERADEC